MDAEKITCPRCKNDDCSELDSYCWNCGILLQNLCSNEECRLSVPDGDGLEPEMSYCPECGSKSTFYLNEYIEPLKFI